MALGTVILVVLFITVNAQVTFFVVSVVLLVNVYMTAFGYFWGLTLNNIMAVNMSFSLGIAVDYSVHIAHTYLFVKPPNSLKKASQRREFKARKAISQMGSSVFHGGFSTFLAISVLAFAKVYTFVVFFKTWFCMIIFGMLNGMVLLPVILSIFGPVDAAVSQESHEEKTASQAELKDLELRAI